MVQQLGGTSNSSVLHGEAIFAQIRFLPAHIDLSPGTRDVKAFQDVKLATTDKNQGNLLGANHLGRNDQRFMKLTF